MLLSKLDQNKNIILIVKFLLNLNKSIDCTILSVVCFCFSGKINLFCLSLYSK